MRKKLLGVLMSAVMAASLAACGGSGTAQTAAVQKAETTAAAAETKAEETKAEETKAEETKAEETKAEETKAEETKAEAAEGDFHIGIVTGSVSQSEDDRRGAEAFQAKYGEDMVKLAIYPDNFTEELETTIQTIVNLSDDPQMKAIIVNQAIPGTTEAFRQIKERRPDIICIAGESHEDLPEIGSAADLVVNNDFVARGYLMIRTAHELGCDTFVHISFPRHMSYETMSRRVAVMKEACKEFGMNFEMETAPDPTTDVGVPGAQAYILEHVPEWVEKYGQNSAYFCTND
ncbi:MAG: DUF3798 domain-containing protein, partial [Stomatobaculum sp.]|nr:DUF3798 domain-containing protein [Stomatobaculum sp.]